MSTQTTPGHLDVQHIEGAWIITSDADLTDEQAAAITFRAEPRQVVMGAYVELEDQGGIRIGHVKTATYHETSLGPLISGPPYVVVGIELR